MMLAQVVWLLLFRVSAGDDVDFFAKEFGFRGRLLRTELSTETSTIILYNLHFDPVSAKHARVISAQLAEDIDFAFLL